MKQGNDRSVIWRDPDFFNYTDHFNKRDWAWEYLRVNPEYRQDYTLDSDVVPTNNSSPNMNSSQGRLSEIRVVKQKTSDLKAGEWGLLCFR